MKNNKIVWNDDDITNINNIVFKIIDGIQKLDIEPNKIVSLFESKGYQFIGCKKNKIVMREKRENFSKKELNIYFKYNKDCTKKMFTGIRFK